MIERPEVLRREPRIPLYRRLAWPAAIAAGWGAWYASESLRHRREDQSGYELLERASPSSPDFRLAVEALTGHNAEQGNRAELLFNGDRIFPAMLEAIRGAEKSISFETYIYWEGEIAREFSEALMERARAGVVCRVLMDAVGAAKMSPGLVAEMREAGCQVVRFRPPRPHLVSRAFNRSHRRVLVCDGRLGFTGGVGIADEWRGNAQDPEHWRDTHLRIEGPIVRALQGAFAEHWVEATGEALVGSQLLPETEPLTDGVAMQVVRSGAEVGDTNMEILYFLAISSAEESIELTAAYFSPRPPFVKALCEAVDRGVRVQVLVPGPHMDKKVVRSAGRSVYRQLVECGVEMYEFQPTMLHAKTMVVDGCWASVGTVNFDNRSFQLNEELTACIYDEGLAGELREQYERDLERAERIEADRWEDRSLLQHGSERASALLRREL